MEKLNVVVCDDEDYYIGEIQKNMDDYSNENDVEFNVIQFNSGEELLNCIYDEEDNSYHIIFLDVEMSGMNGVDTARKVREVLKNTIICFVTSHEGYTLHAFEVEALGYLKKPIEYMQFIKVLDKAVALSFYNIYKEKTSSAYLEINANKEKVLIDKRRIIYIEKNRNRCEIHLVDGDITCYETLSSIYDKLDCKDFIYVHQGYIVSFPKIKEVNKKLVCFGSNKEVPISRKYYSSVKQMHTDKINMRRWDE